MVTKAIVHGNVLAIPISEEMAAQLGVSDTTRFEVRVEGDQLIAAPIRELSEEYDISEEDVAAGLIRVDAQFGEALKRLA